MAKDHKPILVASSDDSKLQEEIRASIKKRKQLKWCVAGSVLSMLMVVIPVSVMAGYGGQSDYFTFGPHENLTIVNIHINTKARYAGLLVAIALINIIKIVSDDIGLPILGYNVYNPDKAVITDFTALELQFLANVMYAMSSIRMIFLTLLAVTQVDVALFSVGIGELTSAFVIRGLLRQKQFKRGWEMSSESDDNDLELVSVNVQPNSRRSVKEPVPPKIRRQQPANANAKANANK